VVTSNTGVGLWKREDVICDISYETLFNTEKEDQLSVYLQVIRRTLRAVIDYIRIRAITAKIEGHELWETVVAFLAAQKPFKDAATGRLVKPHIRACLYLADQFCKRHQDYVKESELVILFSMILDKDGVAGNWVFTPLSNEYLMMGPGSTANSLRSKTASHHLSEVKTVQNVSHHMAFLTAESNCQNLHSYVTKDVPSSGTRFFAQLVLRCPGGKASACALQAALCAIGTRAVKVRPSDRTASAVA